MQILEDLVDSEDNFIRIIADTTRQLNAQRESGEITEDEFVEMMGTVLDLGNLDDIADDVERTAEITEAFMKIKKAFSVINILL